MQTITIIIGSVLFGVILFCALEFFQRKTPLEKLLDLLK